VPRTGPVAEPRSVTLVAARCHACRFALLRAAFWWAHIVDVHLVCVVSALSRYSSYRYCCPRSHRRQIDVTTLQSPHEK